MGKTIPTAPSHLQCSSIVGFLRFIRFSHTVFALPFALVSMLIAANGWPNIFTIAWILVAMVGARTAAMCFNRYVDWEIDKRNPRTMERHHLASKHVAAIGILAGSGALVLAAAKLNALCLWLSPVAIFVIFFYSLTKRFSAFAPVFLGLALSVAPVGAWIAVRGSLELPPLILALGVLCWVAGFDTIYASMDEDFDRAEGLHSIVVRWGRARAFRWALALHGVALLLFSFFGIHSHLRWPYWIALIAGVFILLGEHQIISRHPNDSTQINRAFFNFNATFSFLILVGVIFAL